MPLNETYTVDQFQAGSEPTHTTSGTIATGENLAARTPLGQVAATGKFVEWDPAAADGSEVAVRLTAYAVDASAADQKADLIKSGCFNIDAINWPAGTTDIEKAVAFVGTPISTQALLQGD